MEIGPRTNYREGSMSRLWLGSSLMEHIGGEYRSALLMVFAYYCEGECLRLLGYLMD